MTGTEPKILIFGGTTEGRLLAEFCHRHAVPVTVSTATEYGGSLVERSEWVEVVTGRKDQTDIIRFIEAHAVRAVFDATHPFAVEASRNIAEACRHCGVRYFRVLREENDCGGCGREFDGIPSVTDYLNLHREGRILITTGSKELHLYRNVVRFSERCAVRVLPSEEIIAKCTSLGFREEMIIAQKGPFSLSENIRQLRHYKAAFLVTKQSGNAGGFDEKRKAAEICGAELLMIRRPGESGISLEQAKQELLKEVGHE